jgi:DNA-directed RNA polymerase subunit beta'
LTKKTLDIIGHVLNATSVPETAGFLDNMKDMGYKFAFKGGLSFSLGDIRIPDQNN